MRTVRRWTADEDRKLKELAKAGNNARDIGPQMNRSASAVRKRAELLSIALPMQARRVRPAHIPTYPERVAIDAIKNSRPLPPGVGPATIVGMTRKGWIVLEETSARKYRVTDSGVEAVRRRIPVAE
ncbi:MAG: hypothetical protein AB1586_31060 [Pseudomonadota bacterium]